MQLHACYISFYNITSTIIAGLPSSPITHFGNEWQAGEREDTGSTMGKLCYLFIYFIFYLFIYFFLVVGGGVGGGLGAKPMHT